MKKSAFLLGLLTTAFCLTACGSKDYNMSFEEALDIASHSTFQDIIAQNDNFEQNFDVAGNYESEGNKVDASISSTSKQSLSKKNSETSTKFTANITASGETVKVDGVLDIKLADNTVYLNLSSLDITGSEDLAMVEMMVEGFKNQWFSIPTTGLNDTPSSLSIIKDSEKLNAKLKEIVINEGSVTYDGTFSEFKGYNARKISLDNDKLNEVIKEYYSTLSSELGEEAIQEVPTIDIQNFEGYLVITGKDKVTIVIENMAMADENGDLLNANGYAGDDFKLYLSDGENDLVSIAAQKKGSKYEVSATMADTISLIGTVSSKTSKSSIDLKFDGTLRVKSEEEGTPDIVIPFKGSWGHKSISDFSVTAPESAQDLTELLGSYLGGMMGGEDYDYDEDYDYEGLYLDEEDNSELEDVDAEVVENEEAVESTEVAENLEVEESVEVAE